jgi:folate-binding protein YgfZ
MTLSDRLEAARTGSAVGPAVERCFLRVTGADAQDFLHRMSTQDLNRLRPGEADYGAFLNAKGHLIGEGHVLVREGELVVALEPSAGGATRAHLEKFVIMDDVTFEEPAGGLRALPVFGPEAASRVAAARIEGVRVATGRRGAPCLELWMPAAAAAAARAALLAAGAVPLSADELEVLRVLGGVARYGQDMDETRLPMEAGLTREAISFTKGCYIGQEMVMRATARGHLQRGLVRLALPPGTPRGAKLTADGREAGQVTSAVDGPDGRVGLGYVKRAWWEEGTRLATEGGEAVVTGKIVWEPAA